MHLHHLSSQPRKNTSPNFRHLLILPKEPKKLVLQSKRLKQEKLGHSSNQLPFLRTSLTDGK